MTIKTKYLALLVSSALLAASSAQATTLTFEDLSVGTTLSNQYSGFGVTFSANTFTGAGSSSSGEAWAANTDMTIVSSTGSDVGGLGTPAGTVSGNILRSFAGWLSEDGDPSFLMTFSTPISSISAAFAGVSTAADVRLFAYDGATLLGTVAGSSSGQFVLSFSSASITSVAIAPGSFNDWVGVDNITFQSVPEPSSMALMSLIGIIGYVGRRSLQRRSQA